MFLGAPSAEDAPTYVPYVLFLRKDHSAFFTLRHDRLFPPGAILANGSSGSIVITLFLSHKVASCGSKLPSDLPVRSRVSHVRLTLQASSSLVTRLPARPGKAWPQPCSIVPDRHRLEGSVQACERDPESAWLSRIPHLRLSDLKRRNSALQLLQKRMIIDANPHSNQTANRRGLPRIKSPL